VSYILGNSRSRSLFQECIIWLAVTALFGIFNIYLLPRNGDIHLELEIIMFVLNLGNQLSLVVRRVSNIGVYIYIYIYSSLFQECIIWLAVTAGQLVNKWFKQTQTKVITYFIRTSLVYDCKIAFNIKNLLLWNHFTKWTEFKRL
jgi:hypothetical protein